MRNITIGIDEIRMESGRLRVKERKTLNRMRDNMAAAIISDTMARCFNFRPGTESDPAEVLAKDLQWEGALIDAAFRIADKAVARMHKPEADDE